MVQTFATGTSKSAPTLPVFDDLDFQIGLVPQRRVNFAGLNFIKSAEPSDFNDFDFRIALKI